MYMRPGGEEIERFKPKLREPSISSRIARARRSGIWKAMESLFSTGRRIRFNRSPRVSVTTRTESEPVKGKPQPPAITSSKGMSAQFEPKTGDLVKLEQWDDFKYQEGDRQAKADRAVLDQAKDQITLTGSARVWDPTGSTAAKTIVMAQKTGDVQADGDVTSTRLPDKKADKKGGAPSMLSGTSRCKPKPRG